MQRPSPLTFATFVVVPEVRAAVVAAEEVRACVGSGRTARSCNPLYLHGETGTGKTHLVHALADAVARQDPQFLVTMLTAGDTMRWTSLASDDSTESLAEALSSFRGCELFIVEDLQHLASRHEQTLALVFDDLVALHVQMVFTARVGPRQLDLSSRLTSRLASGLVVRLDPPSVTSRRALLEDKAQRRQQAIAPAVLDWLAENLNGGTRPLEGALLQLEQLGRGRRDMLDVSTVVEHFRDFVNASRPSVERIAQKVSALFCVDPRSLCSDRRGRGIVLPRHIGMYLARQLTRLSLDQIGSYFGGRDHSTVLHACRKVESSLTCDFALSSIIRQLTLDLA